MLNLKGAVITIDAMGTQSEIAAKIVEGKGDYLLCVKENQKSLHREISDHFEFAARQLDIARLDPKNWSHHQSGGSAHGRVEKRQTVVCHRLEWMDSDIRAAWKGLESIIMVERRNTTGECKTRSQLSYYMSSLKNERAEEMQGYIRGHWDIENGCHWVLDTLSGKTTTRLGNAMRQRTSEPCAGSLSTRSKSPSTTANENESGQVA